jgi:O-antigen ligase
VGAEPDAQRRSTWGITGVAVLYAMWLAHPLLFRGSGMAYRVGLLVVVQNLVSSLFNSHLFDFHKGWIYVLGVGIAGGMNLGPRNRDVSERIHPCDITQAP